MLIGSHNMSAAVGYSDLNMSVEKHLPFKAVNPDLRKYGPVVRGRIMIVEGLISAGKSTLGKEMTKYLKTIGIKCKFFPEPVIPDLLQLFLSNQKKYAYAFQLAMLIKRQAIYREAASYAEKGYFCIIDRGLYGDYCFALMHKNRGNISDQSETLESGSPSEWGTYLSVLHLEDFEHPDYVVYLRVDVETAIQRCMKRDRAGEKKYDREYFRELRTVYDAVIPSTPAKNFEVVDWNQERTVGEIPKVILDHLKRMYDYNGGQ